MTSSASPTTAPTRSPAAPAATPSTSRTPRPTATTSTSCEEVVPVPPEPATDATPPSVIRGGPGNDTLFGTPAPDSLFGQDGNDELFGNDEARLRRRRGRRRRPPRRHRRRRDVRPLRTRHRARQRGQRHDRGRLRRRQRRRRPRQRHVSGTQDGDTVQGGEGDDRISEVDGAVDRVDCGPGNDVAFVDADDSVSPHVRGHPPLGGAARGSRRARWQAQPRHGRAPAAAHRVADDPPGRGGARHPQLQHGPGAEAGAGEAPATPIPG